jgi:hypothetical protein
LGKMTSVAILGAGLSGAVAARRLAEAGLAVTVLDKGRGVGGRMATRRGSDPALAFDHGAQFMRARGPAFAACLADWEARGIVAPWSESGRFVGTPGMTAPVRDLLAGLTVRSGLTVTGLTRDADGWSLATAEAPLPGRFDALVVSFPAPQIRRLLESSGLSLPGLGIPVYAPCWSLMLALQGPAPFEGPDLAFEVEPIAYVARDDSKPGRLPGPVRLVVHAAPDWSRTHLEDDRDSVATALVHELGRLLGAPVTPIHASVHRWRYAMVETPLGQDCLYDPGQRLGACGDWCLGGRVEAAFDSGAAVAARLLAGHEAG